MADRWHGALLALVLALAWQLASSWPPPHRALNYVAYHPASCLGFTGPYVANNALVERCHALAAGALRGPETAIVTRNGTTVVVGDVDGFLVAFDFDPQSGRTTSAPRRVAFVGGRPLGLVLGSGNAGGRETVLVAEPAKGLVEVDLVSGLVHVLSAAAAGEPLAYADDVDVGRSGTVYFTDASTVAPWRRSDGRLETMGASVLEFVESRGTGRVLAFDRGTGQTRVLAHGLLFANGIAVSDSEDYVLVAETYARRLVKIALSGAQAGEVRVLVDSLPGYPDGISRGANNTFLVAIASPCVAAELALPYTWLKPLLLALPDALKPKPIPYGLVVRIRGSDGLVLDALHDPTGVSVQMATGVVELANGALLIGHLHGDSVTYCRP